jgi:hypothetical protein
VPDPRRYPIRVPAGRRSGVGIDADRVHAILDHGVERARQFMFAQIMLIPADADGFRIDLDQFCEWVLQALTAS